jgi:hypothetical protein
MGQTDEAQKHDVVMISSSKPWLADKKVFLKNGFKVVGQAPLNT